MKAAILDCILDRDWTLKQGPLRKQLHFEIEEKCVKPCDFSCQMVRTWLYGKILPSAPKQLHYSTLFLDNQFGRCNIITTSQKLSWNYFSEDHKPPVKPNPTWNNIVAAPGRDRAVIAAENPLKHDDVSCRVCFVSGEIVDPNTMNEGPGSRCFTLGLWFHAGWRADLMVFFIVECTSVSLCVAWAFKLSFWTTAEHHQFCCILGHAVDWTKYVVSCRVGFCVGISGDLNEFHTVISGSLGLWEN